MLPFVRLRCILWIVRLRENISPRSAADHLLCLDVWLVWRMEGIGMEGGWVGDVYDVWLGLTTLYYIIGGCMVGKVV